MKSDQDIVKDCSENERAAQFVLGFLEEMSTESRINFFDRLKEKYCLHCGKKTDKYCYCEHERD